MALLNFKYGAQSTLPSEFKAGTVYITTDTRHMYVDLPETGSKHLSIGNFQLVEYSSGTAVTALTNYAVKETNVLYVALNTTSKDTALYRYDGTNFVAISNTAEISAIVARLDGIDDSISALESEVDGKAPKAHAVNANTYGLGTNSVYGHVKLSDSTTSTSGQTAGIAATPAAVKSAYDRGTEGVNAAATAKSTADTAVTNAAAAQAAAEKAQTAADKAQDEVDALETVVAGKAPTNHASTGTDYGVGNSTNYGHLKLSDATDGTATVSGGVAATPKAVAAAYARGSQGITDAAAAKSAADAAATAASSANANANGRVSKSGDTMTGALTLSGAPTVDLHAATKKYVDDAKSSAINTASADATNKANAVLGDSNDTATDNTVYGAKAAAAAANTAASNAQTTANAAVKRAGDTMTGLLTLSGAPTANLHAATKKYVDDAKASAISAVQGASSDAATATTVYGAKKYTDNAIATVNSTINTLKNDIGNLSNIMNFVGTTSTVLTDGATTKPIKVSNADYTQATGDVVVTSGGAEFVWDGSKWCKIGDTSSEAAAITALQTKMSAAEGNITDLQGDMTEAQSDIAALDSWKGTHETAYTELEGRVDTLESWKTSHTNDYNTLNSTVSGHTTSINSLNSTVSSHTTAIGKSGDAANASGSLYARIAKNKADIATNATAIAANDAAIDDLITVLTWVNWDA